MRSGRRHSEYHGLAVGGGGSAVSDINVTPLVDVCLVLLIIFMVVTPMLQSGVPVVLPETGTPDKVPETGKQVKLAITEDGKIFLSKDDWVPSLAELQRRMTEMNRETPDKEIVIKADKRLKYRDVREVMKALNEAGFKSVGLVTTKKGS
jgi:biopolymer transport protein TolR